MVLHRTRLLLMRQRIRRSGQSAGIAEAAVGDVVL
jgi:hypothetical protein